MTREEEAKEGRRHIRVLHGRKTTGRKKKRGEANVEHAGHVR